MWQSIKRLFIKDTVLSLSILLAVCSMLPVHPDREYIGYIDVRTLAILFCLMAVVGGWKEIGLFDFLAQQMLVRIKKMWQVVLLLVLLCFFFGMIITNDVALITFVPLTIIVLKQMGEDYKNKWLVCIVVMQTIAANLGSMLTPIGNPQNLYLFEKANMGVGEFVLCMLPYSIFALAMLLLWIFLIFMKRRMGKCMDKEKTLSIEVPNQIAITEKKKCFVYLILFLICLLTVARVIPYWLGLVIVIIGMLLMDTKVLKNVDYSLLGTFVGFFIFIGNLGRIPVFHDFLSTIVEGHEIITAVLSSQVMSNVPAALLLSGFTQRYDLLLVGVNLGGLGTLIASMASLISYKYIAGEDRQMKGNYLFCFTVANLLFLGAYFLFLQVF